MRSPHPKGRFRRCAVVLSTVAAALMLTASPAAADSVAFVKDGNVWLATPDGSRQYQVTSDGGYATASQADNGRIVALRGDKIRHLERDGRLIAEIATPVTTTSDPTLSFRGPFDPEVSPDGKRVAYTYYWQYIGEDPYCNPSNGCYTKRLYHGTGFSDPNRLTAWDEPGFQRRSGWIDAAWVDNDTVLLSDPYIQPNEDVILWSPSDKESLRRWFADPEHYGDIGDATISRDKSAMATVADDAKIRILRSRDLFYPQYPVVCFEVTNPAGSGEAAKFSSPTFKADGTRLYWAEGDGVHAVSLPKLGATGCGAVNDAPKLIVPGGANPSWGPADVPPPRPAPEQPKPPTPAPAAPKPPTSTPLEPATPGDSMAARLVATRTSLRAALRRGVTIRLRGARPGRYKLAGKVGRTRVAGAKLVVGADGGGRARLRFTTRAKRQLAHRRSVTVTVTGAGARVRVRLTR